MCQPASQIEGGVRVHSYEAHLLPMNVPWTRLEVMSLICCVWELVPFSIWFAFLIASPILYTHAA